MAKIDKSASFLFNDLSQEEFEVMLEVLEERDFAAGSLICRQGEPGQECFFLVDGEVEILQNSRGRSRCLAVRQAGEVVGEMAILEDKPRSATMTARTPVRALALKRDSMKQVLERKPKLALHAMRVLSARMRSVQDSLLDELMQKVEQLEASNAELEKKVAERTLELSEANQKLADMAVRDFLTKCFNRRYLQEHLERLCSEARQGSRFAVLLMDIDHFKHYNDNNGHLAGDDLLQGFAEKVRLLLRDGDLLARYGGEEFAAVLTRLEPEDAADVAERIRRGIAEHDFPFRDQQPLGLLSVSGGVARYPTDASDPTSLLKLADDRLYQAKESGRNRVVCG